MLFIFQLDLLLPLRKVWFFPIFILLIVWFIDSSSEKNEPLNSREICLASLNMDIDLIRLLHLYLLVIKVDFSIFDFQLEVFIQSGMLAYFFNDIQINDQRSVSQIDIEYSLAFFWEIDLVEDREWKLLRRTWEWECRSHFWEKREVSRRIRNHGVFLANRQWDHRSIQTTSDCILCWWNNQPLCFQSRIDPKQ